MRSFVINLARSTERYQHFRAGWNAPFPCERVEAVDAEKITLFSPWKHNRGGCALNITYIWIFAEMLRCGEVEPFAIFEDDALFSPAWWLEVEATLQDTPPGWWQINLGPEIGQSAIYNDRLVRLKSAWRTHAVVYNPATLADQIAMLGRHPIPVDQVWCHMMLDIGSPHFYATRKFLVGSRANKSICTGLDWCEFVGPNGLGKSTLKGVT